MANLDSYTVIWHDKGNCDIASVEVAARSVHEAIVLSYNGLNQKQFDEVQEEAVGITAGKIHE